MLNRDQQNLLGALGSAMAADALLDSLRERETLEGGRSARQEGCWINYNRKAVWLEDHSGFSEAMKAAGTDTEAWRRIRPRVVLKVTWADTAAYGATLPRSCGPNWTLCAATSATRTADGVSSAMHAAAGHGADASTPTRSTRRLRRSGTRSTAKHLVALRDVRDRQKAAISRALPLTVDVEPVDLLELLDQQPDAPAAPTQSAALQAGALLAPPTAPSPTLAPDEGLFTLPGSSPATGR